MRYGGALSPTSSMHVNLSSLKCTGKVGVYPSDIEQEEKRALENRLNALNETLIEHILDENELIESELEDSKVSNFFQQSVTQIRHGLINHQVN